MSTPAPPADVSERPASTRDVIRDAAVEEFVQFGYRRSAMNSIARRAGVSRATVYLYWSAKEALFRDAVAHLHGQAVEAMEQALADPAADLESRWARLLAARFSRFVQLAADSPVAEELYDTHARLCADIAEAAEAQSRALLERAVEQAVDEGEVDVTAVGATLHDVVTVLEQLAHGAKSVSDQPSGPSYDEAVRRAVRMLLGGIAVR